MMGNGYGDFPGSLITWLLPLAILDLVLRGFALWKSAKRGQNIWFIFLLVVNSLGILPAIYLLMQRGVKTKKR